MLRLLALLFVLCVGAMADQCEELRCVGSWSYCGYEDTDNDTGLKFSVSCNPISSFCYAESGSSWTKGICVPLADEGEYCDDDDECKGWWLANGGRVCRDSRCIATGLNKGDRCQYSASCISGRCWNGRCTESYLDTYVLKGSPCTGSSVCEPGTTCYNDVCVPIALDGQSCNGTVCFGECSSDNVCHYLSRGEGESCTTIWSCRLGLVCLGGTTCTDPESVKILNTSCDSCNLTLYECACDAATQKQTCQVTNPLTQDQVDAFERVTFEHMFYKNSTSYENWYAGYLERYYGAQACGEDFSGSSSLAASLLVVLAILFSAS